jgi:uncharacterized membrane protein
MVQFSIGNEVLEKDFIKEVRQKVKEGISAAFLLTESAATDRIAEVEQNTNRRWGFAFSW